MLQNVPLSAVSEEVLNKFLKAEKRFIEKSKYYRGEKIKKDPGDEYIIEWISKNADKFRRVWDICICKDCKKGSECGDCLKIECDFYDPE